MRRISKIETEHSVKIGFEKYTGISIWVTDGGDTGPRRVVEQYEFLISDEQCCCETYGYLLTEDDVSEFVNSEFIKIELVDTALDKTKVDDIHVQECLDLMFINVETTNGTLQFVAYNNHNGYYGHNMLYRKTLFPKLIMLDNQDPNRYI